MVDAYEPDEIRPLGGLRPASKRLGSRGADPQGSRSAGLEAEGVLDAGEPADAEAAAAKSGNPVARPAAEGRPERVYLGMLLHQLASRVRREQLETWFRSLDVVRMERDQIEFSVTSQFVRDWLQKNFLPPIQQAVAAVDSDGPNAIGRVGDGAADSHRTNKRIVLSYREEDGWDSLRFAGLDVGPGQVESSSSESTIVGDANQHGQAPQSSPAWTPGSIGAGLGSVMDPIRRNFDRGSAAGSGADRAAIGGSAQPFGSEREGPRLNPNYTFDKFVVGACNRLGHASSIAIAENPGFAYNPLFVHGNVGLGKSHLLQAICHTIVKRSPAARVIYMSCEDFTNAFIQAIQSKQVEAFRKYYRDADVLVIDDVQFLAHKDKTQDEFFHTFNALYDAQKQIVLSSDRPPIEIPTIEERLVSRFKWGLVTEVEAPCFETRKAIVQRKAMGRGTELPQDVARFLAERVATNIRELEGAVIKVVGIAAITGQPITLSLAESCMRGLPVRNGQVSAEDVMELITTEFAVSARDLTGKSRTQMVSLPRQVAMYLIREHTENSLQDVGRIFGGRDHTTVLYAVNKIKERQGHDRTFKDLMESLSGRLLTRTIR